MDATPHDPTTGEVIEGAVGSVNVSASAAQLRSIVQRIEQLESEKADLQEDIADIYKEAKGNGFHVPAIRQVIAERKKDAEKRAEQLSMFDLYWSAVN